MRGLIVGGGVAGLTLAAKLARQDREPVVVEKRSYRESGYAIALYPIGSAVLHGIGAYPGFATAGPELNLRNRRPAGQRNPLARFLPAHGPLRARSAPADRCGAG
jgi:2-polyprenyl-6-methoxyphenol hydroxylase-like FAD-dependent oxidoreductase